MRIGLVGAGAMGSALGASWIACGHEVKTCLRGRSNRTMRLAREVDLSIVGSIDEVMDADIVVSIVPPAAALPVARDIASTAARTEARPLILDLNAVSPATVTQIEAILGANALELVDGVISGTPPSPTSTRTTVYLSGSRAEEVSALSPWYRTAVLGDRVGTASALKMSTSSMYKGTNALVLQAVLTASHFGVLEAFIDDVSGAWPDNVARWPREVALAATKSDRFVDEMREIAATQLEAGLTEDLFLGVAAVFARAARSDLARSAPETITHEMTLDALIERLR